MHLLAMSITRQKNYFMEGLITKWISARPEEVGQLSREFCDQSNRAIFYASWLRFLSRKFTQDGKNL